MRVGSEKTRWAAVAVVVVLSAAAWGQARSERSLRGPSSPGLSPIGGQFGTQSFGVGNLEGSGSAGPGLLRSSIYSRASYSLARSGAGGQAGAMGLTGSPLPTAQAAATPGLDLVGLVGTMAPQAGSGTISPGDFAAVAPYLAVLGFEGELDPKAPEPVTTFVPDEPTVYQANMQRGDEAFRAGDYKEAAGAFKVATVIAGRAPEGHLALVHALFAQGQYRGASGHLREALTYLGELPLAHIQVRSFYGTPRDFVAQVDALQGRIDDSFPDPDLLLLLAYFRYFDGDSEKAAQALREGAASANKPETKEAIQTFWDGMVAAGKITGSLPSTQPATASGPAGPAEPHRPVPDVRALGIPAESLLPGPASLPAGGEAPD